MHKEDMAKIFDDMGGEAYDKNNAFFKPLQDNLQLLNRLILKELPEDASILSVGVGTGVDILGLAEANPGWSFVGVDPAKSMLERCEEKLEEKGLMDRCELFHGYLSDYKSDKKFDAVLCLFVLHFVKGLEERGKMFSAFGSFLKKDGFLINTEISVDIKSPEYGQLIENWKSVHGLAGASKEKLNHIPIVIEKELGVLSPEQTKELINKNGFKNPIHFFQSFLIRGWYSRKA
jgi:tRNA (cmo5U34)-methyltransferase